VQPLATEFPHALHLSRAKAKHNWNSNMILMHLSKKLTPASVLFIVHLSSLQKEKTQ